MVFIHVHVVVKLSIIQLDSFLLDLIERMCGSVEISYFIKQMHEIKCCSYILVKKIKVILYPLDGAAPEMPKEHSTKRCDYRCLLLH